MSFCTTSSDSASDMTPSSSDSSAPSSPSKKRRRPVSLRLTDVGVDPGDLVGKVLTRIRRSPKHPTVTLDFSDNTTFQILVDGYNPIYPGVPKTLETDSLLDPIFNPPGGQSLVELTVVDCAMITLTDKAFQMNARMERWDQNHLAVAFKFAEHNAWHCVWAVLMEHDDAMGNCVFRSYDDVYLEQLQRSPWKRQKRDASPSKKPWK